MAMASRVPAAGRYWRGARQSAMCRGTVSSAWTPVASPMLERSSVPLAQASIPAATSSQSRRFLARHATGEDLPLSGQDSELYDLNFKPFGVSVELFRQFMGYGTRCRASEGEVLIQGNMQNDKVILILRGEAIACRPVSVDKDSLSSSQRALSILTDSEPTPVYRYVGQMEPAESTEQASLAPLAGSTIGAGASFFPDVATKGYPYTISASSKGIEWVEWMRTDLNFILKQPGNQALQAWWCHLLYVQVVDRAKERSLFQRQRPEGEEKIQVAPPKPRQLIQLSAFIAIPFFGFGFADNFIMIVCGDAIDSHFGVVLGLSTMAAAGLGNWCSDVVGLGLGDAIERWCEKLGLNNGRLTPAQEKLSVAKWTKLFSRVIGISLGCIAGMCPLLFMTSRKKEFREEDLEVYDAVFRPHGVSASTFSDLMDMGKRCTVSSGSTIVPEGKPFGKLLLILRGELASYKTDNPEVMLHYYIGRLDLTPRSGDAQSAPAGNVHVRTRETVEKGYIVGGTKFVDESKIDRPYKYNIVAMRDIEYIVWDFKELKQFMNDEKAVEASFMSLLYQELLKEMKMDATTQELKHYRHLLSAVLSDGVVDAKERIFMCEMRQLLNVSDTEHFNLLAEQGWDRTGWEKGTMIRRELRRQSSDDNLTPATGDESSYEMRDVSLSQSPLEDSVIQLEKASRLIEEALWNMKAEMNRPADS